MYQSRKYMQISEHIMAQSEHPGMSELRETEKISESQPILTTMSPKNEPDLAPYEHTAIDYSKQKKFEEFNIVENDLDAENRVDTNNF